jgi:hypothetical protein
MTALSNMRVAEFKRLGDEIYVDHAGATLPSEKQLQDVFKVTSAGLDIQPGMATEGSNPGCMHKSNGTVQTGV